MNKVLSLIGLMSILSSCASNKIEFVKYDYNVKDNDTYERIETEGYVKESSYSPFTFVNKNGVTETFNTFNDVYRSQNYLHNMNSLGNNKMIVIPIDFNDYECSKLRHGCKLSKTLIENAFFGDPSVTKYESVASYYNKSSYGKLRVDGFVTDWFRLTDLYDSSHNQVNYEYLSRNTTKKTIVIDIYQKAIEWYQNKYGNISSYYIDGDKSKGVPIYLVYSGPNAEPENAADSALWAYTFNTSGVFAWSSFSMIEPSLNNKVETHTLIHETGHILGLTDYYSDSTYSLTGHVDMMDYSIGDHTSYSKMLLNWVRPYHIKNSTTIKIKPFVNSGDVILIKDNWNNTVFDEYLLIEMYSPSGLNQLDSKSKHPEAKLFSDTGIKIYHVDSRVAYFSPTKVVPLAYVSEGGYTSSTNRIGIAHSNTITPNNRILKNGLYELLDKNESISYLDGGYATNSSLFKQGDSFGISSYKDFTFHSGDKLGYTIHVDSLNKNEATLTITKI